MANDKASGGNITLIKNAPRDKDGKRKGSFSQVDHTINALAAGIGLDGYGIYHFLLNNTGGNFRCTIKAIASIFKKDQLSEDRIKRAITRLCKAGLLKKERCGYNGRRPLYSYQVYEVSTKIQLSEQPAPTTSTQAGALSPAPAVDTSDFSAAEIEQTIAATAKAPAPIASPSLFITAEETTSRPERKAPTADQNAKRQQQTTPAPSTQSGDDYKQHVFDICQSKGAFSQTAKEKVIKCCRKYYAETKQFADDNLIAQFANRFSENSGQNVATVYDDIVRL